MKDFKERLIAIDDGRFEKVLNGLNVKPVCEGCNTFNPLKRESYKCAVLGRCPGITLSDRTKEYLIKRCKE